MFTTHTTLSRDKANPYLTYAKLVTHIQVSHQNPTCISQIGPSMYHTEYVGLSCVIPCQVLLLHVSITLSCTCICPIPLYYIGQAGLFHAITWVTTCTSHVAVLSHYPTCMYSRTSGTVPQTPMSIFHTLASLCQSCPMSYVGQVGLSHRIPWVSHIYLHPTCTCLSFPIVLCIGQVGLTHKIKTIMNIV